MGKKAVNKSGYEEQEQRVKVEAEEMGQLKLFFFYLEGNLLFDDRQVILK